MLLVTGGAGIINIRKKVYRELIERFEFEKIPISVAVIDMDWHLVDIEKSMEADGLDIHGIVNYFPIHQGFLRWLHEQGLHVTLNVHPADGVRAYEEVYETMGKALGMSDDGRKERSAH